VKLQWKIAISVLFFGALTAILLNIMVYTHLYNRDLDSAREEAHRTASLIRTALLNVMIHASGDYKEIGEVLMTFQNERFMSFRMIKGAHVIKQHGKRPGEEPADAMEKEALATGKIIEHMDSDYRLRIIYPFITDERCGQCHMDMGNKPVGIGVVNGAAVLGFDLSAPMEKSRSIIFYIMAILSVGGGIFLAVILYVINRTFTVPVMQIAEAIKDLKNEKYDVTLPEVTTQEIMIMAGVVKEAAVDLSKKVEEREKIIAWERARAMEFEKFVRGRASSLGLEVETEIPEIMGRLTTAVDEVKKKNLVSRAVQYVEEEKSVITIPSDPDLIPAITAYLSSLVEGNIGPAKTGSLELTLDEALNNAVYHGNLDVPSHIKTGDFDMFYELARKRQRELPYANRKVMVQFHYTRDSLMVRVRDEGMGFDWKKYTAAAVASDLPHGRGLILMRALSYKVDFNEQGNEVTLHFGLDQSPAVVPA
jgi:anti-sigma regulatory factor (Ser/Thr protein kinase)